MVHRAEVMYSDPEASKYVWGTGFHWYSGDHFENVKLHNEAYPDKKLLFTEGCVFPFDYNKLSDWNWGERYGESILHDLNNSAAGWVDWNILLDETGGPNHVANFCYAPVIGNTKTGEVIYMNSFYYLGHFSKFIRPGAKRILCSTNYDDLLATAMLNPDGSIALVLMNQTDAAIDFRVWIDNRGLNTSSPAHSISTIVFN
jgi:glucosylceramidase